VVDRIYSDGVETKERLRQELASRRAELTPDKVAVASFVVVDRLRRVVDWPSLHSLHVYRSVAEWGELDTSELVAWVEGSWPAIEIVQPTHDKDQPFPEQEFDLIVVPVLGFDRDNNRLGLGGGWYDRFAARQPQAQKIGLAYTWALVEDGIPVEPWDVKLDGVVTN
jgi:5-formyltetrahydrofolate cyclo-ligase